jgi:glycosyltransferase involved in cell wall biosynthesis
MSSNIDIITVCYNSSHFITNLIKSLDKNTNQDYRMVIVDNGSSEDHQEVLDKIEKERGAFILRRIQAPVSAKHAASRHHGEALQHAVTHLPLSHIGVIIDCDSYVIKKDWDIDVLRTLDNFQHISCKRPGVKFGCGAWFSAFRISTVIDNEISFLPVLKLNGCDCPRPNLYDVGSDMVRIEPWKPLFNHPKLKYHHHSHVWMFDESFFIDHLGGCRAVGDVDDWSKWISEKWG